MKNRKNNTTLKQMILLAACTLVIGTTLSPVIRIPVPGTAEEEPAAPQDDDSINTDVEG